MSAEFVISVPDAVRLRNKLWLQGLGSAPSNHLPGVVNA